MANMDEDASIAEREHNKLQSLHAKLGYKEGSSQGHDKVLQQGFNVGFNKGVQDGIHWGQLLGEINALKTYYVSQEQFVSDLTSLHEDIKRTKQNYMKTTPLHTTETSSAQCSTVNKVIETISRPEDIVKYRTKLTELIDKYII